MIPSGALLALALASLPVAAEEPISLESIANGYLNAESYCDSGKLGWGDPKQPGTRILAFERCGRRDGRFKYIFKYIERHEVTVEEVRWSDANMYYRYVESANFYRESSAYYAFRQDHSRSFPIFVFDLISKTPRLIADKAERTRYFQSYKPNSTLSTQEYSVFERFDANSESGERLWVRNADKSIARYEWLNGAKVVHFVEITTRELNRPLADADLWYDAPLSARYTLENRPKTFFAGLHIAAGLAGVLFWGLLFARRGAEVERAMRTRMVLWRLVRRTAVVGALAFMALAASFFSAGGFMGVIILGLPWGVWGIAVFSMICLFMLTSYPVEQGRLKLAAFAQRNRNS